MEDFSAFLDELEKGRPATAPTTVAPVAAPEADTGFSSFLDILDNARPSTVPAVVEPVAEEPAFQDYSQKVYSESDLLSDDFYQPIEDYMVDRFGDHIRGSEREEVVEMFTNNMRGFAGGNSVRAVNEITYLNEVSEDEEKLARAGQAYALYEGMQSVFGETSWGEKAEIVTDFARSAVLDPINVMTLGVGKVATGTGFKAGSQVARIAAKQAYNKALSKGATKEAAQKAGEKTLRVLRKVAHRDAARKAAARQAIEANATTTLQRMTTQTALKEAAVVGSMEGAISAGTDYLYQDAMLRTAVQEEYDLYQTGLSAVVGLVAGGISAAVGNVRTGAAGTVTPQGLKTTTKGSTSLSKVVNQTPANTTSAGAPPSSAPYVPGAANWLKDVAKGKELADQDTKFFYTMLLGDSKKGLKGLAQNLLEEGYVWVPRTPDDKVSNWVGDIIKYADPQDAKQFIEDFTKATGIEMAEGKQLTIEAFADTFKKKMSDSGYVLSAASQVARLLGREAKDITLDDYASVIMGGGAAQKTSKLTAAGSKLGEKLGRVVSEEIPDFQNNLIRLMVANLSTTSLNVSGYTTATLLNSATDISRAVLLGGQAGLQLLKNPAAAKNTSMNAIGILANQKQKALFALDPNTTYDTFLAYSRVRPKAMAELTQVLPGGVESLDKAAKEFDPNTSLVSLGVSQGVDFVAKANLVAAQDGYTKSIEFLSQMDKLLRRPESEGGFNMSWNEFFSGPNQHKMMLSEKFVALEAKAVNDTLETVFSKSYKGKDALGEVAGIIEDARNIPGIGMLMPFGRFFNNTIAATYDATALGPLLSKFMGGEQDKFYSEILARGVVTISLLGYLAEREVGFIEQGLSWSEEIDKETGEVVDEKYDFPYGAYKAAARLIAHSWRDEEIPLELTKQIGSQFIGQLTRELGEAGEGVSNIFAALISEQGPEYSKLIGNAGGNIASQIFSAMSRPLEPINALIGLSRDEQYYVPDRKQGTKWVNESMRYVDQLIALFRGNENVSPPVFSAAEGQPRTTPSRLISTTRASRLTNTERVMNMIGRPTWTASMASMSEAGDNRYNKLFNEIVEKGSTRLFNSKGFQNADLETREYMVGNLLSEAASSTKTFMEKAAARAGDDTLAHMIRISEGYSKDKIDRVMNDLEFEKSFEELTDNELEALETSLKYREEFLLNKAKTK